MEQAAGDMAVGILPRAAYLAAMERAGARLEEIDAMVTEASRESVVAELIISDDVRGRGTALTCPPARHHQVPHVRHARACRARCPPS